MTDYGREKPAFDPHKNKITQLFGSAETVPNLKQFYFAMPPLSSRLFDTNDHRTCNNVSPFQVKITVTTTSKGPISSPKENRTVSFALYAQVRNHFRRSDYTTEEKNSCWFSQSEFDEMRKERHATVSIMGRGQPMVNDGQHYYRGLEGKTREGYRRKQFNIVDARMAVLDEQTQQNQTDFSDFEAIAKAYRSCTAHCLAAAQNQGLVDQRLASAGNNHEARRLSCRAA